jgi:hypothetical protein
MFIKNQFYIGLIRLYITRFGLGGGLPHGLLIQSLPWLLVC